MIYPILKNSEGCIFGSQGILTQPLAVPYLASKAGAKTNH